MPPPPLLKFALIIIPISISSTSTPLSPIYQRPIHDESDNLINIITIYANEEPIDAIASFISQNNLSSSYRTSILTDACELLSCSRVQPIIFRQQIDLGLPDLAELIILEDEEPVDAVYQFVVDYDLPDESKDFLMDSILSNEELQHFITREAAIVWEQDIDSVGMLYIYEEEEPVDAIASFLVEEAGLEDYEDRIAAQNQILELACEEVLCSRSRALVWSSPVENEDGVYVGDVEVLEGDEPVDVIHNFVAVNELLLDYREAILEACCEQVSCSRVLPLVYTQNIQNENGASIGQLEVLEGDELIDNVVKFLIDTKPNIDEVALKNHFFQHACNIQGVVCTRNTAKLYERGFDLGQERDLSTPKPPTLKITVMEFEEPVDVIWRWILNHPQLDQSDEVRAKNLRLLYFRNIKKHICEDDEHNNQYITCTKKAPEVFGPQAITGPGGEVVGHLSILLDEEPADAVYKFFCRCGLFKKDWDVEAVIKQVCNLPGVEGSCNRMKAIKHHNPALQITRPGVPAPISLGPLVIWHDEEVIDAIYKLKMLYKLTVPEQMSIFTDICKNTEEVFCKRTRGVVYSRPVNKLDYDVDINVMNGTCSRNYCGWRYIAGWDEIKLVKKFNLITMMNMPQTITLVQHPMFVWKVFAIMFAFARFFLFKWIYVHKRVDKHLVMYRKMFKVGVGLEAVHQKMKKDGNLERMEGVSLYPQRPVQKTMPNGGNLVILVGCLISTTFIFSQWIEPAPSIDSAMHEFLGKLPELEIFENQEVADAVNFWAKEGGKKHHPLLRQPVYYNLMDEVCNDPGLAHLKCTRRRVHEEIDAGSITLWGLEHKMKFIRDVSNFNNTDLGGEINATADTICERLWPPPPNCVEDLRKHVGEQLDINEARRHESKDLYTKIGVTSDATTNEILLATAKMVNSLGTNYPPYARIDNGTIHKDDVYKWGPDYTATWVILDKVGQLLNYEDRLWYDKPCEPVFGGAMCAKKDAKGNMMIEMG